ncbi:MAG: 16S rRNA (guanine(966)-N(2))-methyltransferase RsmD [Lentisphaeria bacterium]|nr:16S rRNA (guanine(966)-N(2))-methyltransferase RsmD [Lentisphaeria bacterium]
MRIVSGWARGIRLAVPQDDAIRPTEDKVKESLFATLGDLRGKKVLDLFSGTGALGLEALSRGASKVVMIEKDPRHSAAIRENLANVLKAIAPNTPGEALLRTEDVKNASSHLSDDEIFDLILADPPYHTQQGQYGCRELLEDAAWLRHANDDTILMLEHATDVRNLPWAPKSKWRLLKERSFGIRTVAFARLATADDGSEDDSDGTDDCCP